MFSISGFPSGTRRMSGHKPTKRIGFGECRAVRTLRSSHSFQI
ncbi:hypothetical protein SAMN04488238_12028 [Roseicitreum antarcticum]|jgi:hypothetical protein|uniref:Uncharacterized protein n=1 Tax=Roseicitreum antarcticum TaxID=564137 RepID=A0A1H3EE44_9RHOB|nr:hypothetical protein SAMN04488238_12028 [Roseicitreum antarcticum]